MDETKLYSPISMFPSVFSHHLLWRWSNPTGGSAPQLDRNSLEHRFWRSSAEQFLGPELLDGPFGTQRWLENPTFVDDAGLVLNMSQPCLIAGGYRSFGPWILDPLSTSILALVNHHDKAAASTFRLKIFRCWGLTCSHFWLYCNGKQKTGWWFGTFLFFPYITNNHPNWHSYFQRGRSTTNQKTWNVNGIWGSYNFLGQGMVLNVTYTFTALAPINELEVGRGRESLEWPHDGSIKSHVDTLSYLSSNILYRHILSTSSFFHIFLFLVSQTQDFEVTSSTIIFYQYVPHKAVAEVSKIGKL